MGVTTAIPLVLSRATERLTQTASRPFRDRKTTLEQRAGVIYPLADTYLRETPGSMMEVLQARIPKDKLDTVAEELDRAIAEVLKKHASDDGDGVAYQALIMAGGD